MIARPLRSAPASIAEASAPIQTGCVIWLTGLSGAGKTTLATLLRDRMGGARATPVLLDGDQMRDILDVRAYDIATRRRLAFVYARLAHAMAQQGFDVIVATISLFHEVHSWNRNNNRRYLEVLLQVPADELTRRAAERDGGIADRPTSARVGFDQTAEFPLAPDLILDNFGVTDPAASSRAIVAMLESKYPGGGL